MRPPATAPTLTDGQVTLRAHRADDAERIRQQCTDPLSIAWTTVPVPYSLQMAREFAIEFNPAQWAGDAEWGFAVEVEGRFQGSVSLRNHGAGRAEIAFGAHPEARGRGWLERACRLLLDWGFAEKHLAVVIWYADRGNFASRRLAWKLGFDILDGVLAQHNEAREQLRDSWVGTLRATDPREPRTRWLDAPVIESGTTPIRIRPARANDLPRVVEGCRDADTQHWLGGIPAPYTAEHARTFLLRRSEEMATGKALHVVAAHRDDERLLGVFEIALNPLRNIGELGYWTHPDSRGRGWTTEAVRLLVRHARIEETDGGLGLTAVTASAASANLASCRVLDRAGFTRIGIAQKRSLTRSGLAETALFEAVF